MDEILYNTLTKYYHALELKGYMANSHAVKLLILIFFRNFVFHDYRGLITKEDYHLIEKALDCIYGSTCLIPYPDYLKMGKLYLGEMTEMAQRVKTLEDTPVLKLLNTEDAESNPNSDVLVVTGDEDTDK